MESALGRLPAGYSYCCEHLVWCATSPARYLAVRGGEGTRSGLGPWDRSEYVASGAVPGAGGPEGFKRFAWLWAEFDDPRAEIRELIEVGDHVVVSAIAKGRGKRSDVETKWSTWQLWTLREGELVRGQGCTSREEALRAAGLPEPRPAD